MTEEMKPKKIDRAYSTTEAGQILGGIDQSTVYRLCRSGRLGYYKIGNRYKVRQSDIDQYLKTYGFVPQEEKEDKE
jgi:excisionase family DNA binding protein